MGVGAGGGGGGRIRKRWRGWSRRSSRCWFFDEAGGIGEVDGEALAAVVEEREATPVFAEEPIAEFGGAEVDGLGGGEVFWAREVDVGTVGLRGEDVC